MLHEARSRGRFRVLTILISHSRYRFSTFGMLYQVLFAGSARSDFSVRNLSPKFWRKLLVWQLLYGAGTLLETYEYIHTYIHKYIHTFCMLYQVLFAGRKCSDFNIRNLLPIFWRKLFVWQLLYGAGTFLKTYIHTCVPVVCSTKCYLLIDRAQTSMLEICCQYFEESSWFDNCSMVQELTWKHTYIHTYLWYALPSAICW
jgi:hypothetical protein